MGRSGRGRRVIRWTGALGLGVWLTWSAQLAAACSLPGWSEHLIDEEERAVDTTAPTPVTGASHSIKRGQGPTSTGCGESSTSCDDLGWISLHLEGASDDRTPPGELGYIFEVTAGTLPDGLTLPNGPVRGQERFTLGWIDGATDEQEGFDFTIDVFPVDLAGNVGEPFSVRLRDEPEDMACAVGAMNANGALPWALLALGLALWRRRVVGVRS